MPSLREQILLIAEEMRAAPGFRDPIISVPKKASKATIRKVEKQLGFSIPETMLKFYNQMNGLTMAWEYCDVKQPYRIIKGKSEIRPLETVFSSIIRVVEHGVWKTDYYWLENSQAPSLELVQCHVLDILECGNCVVFRLDNEVREPALYLYTHDNALYPMRFSFSAYIELLIRTRGMYFWQEYTLLGDYVIDGKIPDDFHKNMARLFPAEDVSVLAKQVKIVESSSYNHFLRNKTKVNYRKKIAEKVESLGENPYVEILNFEFNDSLNLCSLRKATRVLGREIPPGMLAFYMNTNGFILQWKYDDGVSNSIEAQIAMLALEEVFGGRLGRFSKDWSTEVYKDVLWFEDSDLDTIEFLKSLRVIDEYYGLSRQIAIHFPEKKNEPELFLIDRYDQYPLSVSFEGYLEALLETMGLEYWQDFITRPDTLNLKPKYYNGPPFFEKMRKVFPNADLSKFRSS